MELGTIKIICRIFDTKSDIEYENAAKNNADPIVRRFFSELIIFNKKSASSKLPEGTTTEEAFQHGYIAGEKFVFDFYIKIQEEYYQKMSKEQVEEMYRLSEEMDNI